MVFFYKTSLYYNNKNQILSRHKQNKTIIFGISKLIVDFFKSYSILKIKSKKSNLSLKTYETYVKFDNLNLSVKNNFFIYLNFSKKQLYTTKTDLRRKVLFTSSNGSILTKISSDLKISKNHFFLKNDFLIFFFKKILNLKSKTNTLILKANTNDLSLFFQKIEKNKLINLFKNILLKFSGAYNLNKKKRLRSIKKRLKKNFLKNENNILKKNWK